MILWNGISKELAAFKERRRERRSALDESTPKADEGTRFPPDGVDDRESACADAVSDEAYPGAACHVLDVAAQIASIARAHDVNLSIISMQNLLYAVQGMFSVSEDRPLFAQPMIAGTHGPASPIVAEAYMAKLSSISAPRVVEAFRFRDGSEWRRAPLPAAAEAVCEIALAEFFGSGKPRYVLAGYATGDCRGYDKRKAEIEALEAMGVDCGIAAERKIPLEYISHDALTYFDDGELDDLSSALFPMSVSCLIDGAESSCSSDLNGIYDAKSFPVAKRGNARMITRALADANRGGYAMIANAGANGRERALSAARAVAAMLGSSGELPADLERLVLVICTDETQERSVAETLSNTFGMRVLWSDGGCGEMDAEIAIAFDGKMECADGFKRRAAGRYLELYRGAKRMHDCRKKTAELLASNGNGCVALAAPERFAAAVAALSYGCLRLPLELLTEMCVAWSSIDATIVDLARRCLRDCDERAGKPSNTADAGSVSDAERVGKVPFAAEAREVSDLLAIWARVLEDSRVSLSCRFSSADDASFGDELERVAQTGRALGAEELVRARFENGVALEDLLS